jgi:PAS domain S-box-containing protein
MSTEDPSATGSARANGRKELQAIRKQVNRLDEFFWVFDPTLDCFIYVGAAYTRIWERSRDSLTSDVSSFFEAIHPEDRERIRQAYSPDRSGSYDQVYRVRRPDGSIRVVRDRAFPMLNGQRRIDLITGLVSDLTEIGVGKRTATQSQLPDDLRPTIQLDRTQKRYRALFLESVDATLLLDGHGYIVEANHRAGALFGYEPHELVRMHFSSFFSADTLASAVAHWEKVVGGAGGRTTLSVQRKDQTSVVIEVAAGLLHFGPEYIVQATFRGVTPREQLADELEATRDQLAQVQKMELIGQIAGGVAHDFNNLLTVIKGFAEVLTMRLEEDSPAHRDAQKIMEAGESAALLVRRLLTLARHETASREILAPSPLIERVCPLLERALPTNVRLQADVADDLWAIRMDRVELEQIIMNLGINAGDAMPDGGVVEVEANNFANNPTAQNAPPRLAFGRYVHIRVRDGGIGMDEGIRARIFEPFFTTKPKSRGTGLGLATVRNLVAHNKGMIFVDSEPGEGTTFDLYFPRCEALQSH